jgi:hypothetical protein
MENTNLQLHFGSGAFHGGRAFELGRKFARARWIIAILVWAVGAQPTSAQLCDLSSVTLPDKSIQLNMDDVNWPAVASGRLDFAKKDDLYSVTETISATVRNGSSFASKIISKEVAALPNDQCGSIAIIHDSRVIALSGSLQISTPISAQQWGCVIGIRGLLAEGDLNYVITLAPKVLDGKLMFSSDVKPIGDIQTTVPDFDSELTETIKQQLKAASSEMTEDVKSAVAKLQSHLERAVAEAKDPAESLEPLYAPKLASVTFRQQGTSIALVQVRQALVREGTACIVHDAAAQKWTEFK